MAEELGAMAREYRAASELGDRLAQLGQRGHRQPARLVVAGPREPRRLDNAGIVVQF